MSLTRVSCGEMYKNRFPMSPYGSSRTAKQWTTAKGHLVFVDLRRRALGSISFLLLVQGCNKANIEKASLDLTSATIRSSPAQRQVNRPTNTEPIVYVDASQSMRGFAGCQTAPSQFNNTLDRVTSDLAVTTIVRFGERTSGSSDLFESVPMSRAVHCAPFYDRKQNPDYALFQRAFADSQSRPVVYFTDGVQSDWQGSNPGPTLGLLTQWIKSGRALAVLGFRSRFAGSGWSEQQQRMLLGIALLDRPFYVFILAASDADIDALMQKISPSVVGNASRIRFRQNAVSCKLLPGNTPKYSSSANPPWALVEYKNIEASKALLKQECDIDKDYPMTSLTPAIGLQYRRFRQGVFEASTSIPAGTNVKARVSATSTTMHANVGPDASARYGWYLITVRADAGSLRPDIDSMSTDSDGSAAAFSRTYRLSWLIEHLARTHLASQPAASYAITIKYR